MEMQQPQTSIASPPKRRWPLFLIGVLLFLIGPAIYTAQLGAKHLGLPWYLPVLSAVGVILMIASVRQRRGVIRIAALVLFLLVCGFEWYFVFVATRTPEYTGPAKPQAKVPAFTTKLADGKPFTDKDLQSGVPTLLVFFRGHW